MEEDKDEKLAQLIAGEAIEQYELKEQWDAEISRRHEEFVKERVGYERTECLGAH